MSDFNYPLLLQPIAVPKVWGGGKLAKIPCRSAEATDVPIGESWDASTWPTAPDNKELVTVTRITNGPLAGTLLDQVTDIPVVVKVIDSGDKLSVQNHPVLPDVHKNEMWYILQTERDAYLYLGLAEGVTPEQFCEAIRSENPSEEQILDMLQCKTGLKPGSYFNVPTGTVHAIGPGLLTFEISEKTQVTYRLFDYNRERSRGKLDLEDGCKAMLTPVPDELNLDPGLAIYGADLLDVITQFPSFCVVKAVGRKIHIQASRHRHLITATMGDCKISGPNSNWDITLKHTFTCLAPPTDEIYTIDTMGSGEVLISPLMD